MPKTNTPKRATASRKQPAARKSAKRRVVARHQPRRATVTERSGTKTGLTAAARRLRDATATQRVLLVPTNHIALAVDAMRKLGVSGSVKNLTGTIRRQVKP